MRMKNWLLPVLLASMTVLSSCTLLPEEEPIRTAPIVNDYTRPIYVQAPVERGDLTLTEKVTCVYVPVQTEELSFAIGGKIVDKVYAQVGDTVQKGDLLAQLQMEDLDEQIAAVERSISELKLRQTYLEELYTLDLVRHEINTDHLSTQEQQEALEALEQDYSVRRQELADQLVLAQLRIEALRKDLSEHQIRAPFTGTVTYVREFDEGTASKFGERVITLADSTMSLFRADTPHWALFEVGTEYEITVNKEVYTVVVTDEEALGLPVPEKTEGKKAYVYFLLKEKGLMFEDGNYGTIQLILDHREDVLHVATSSIQKSGENKLVFYLDENGLKTYKQVETGLVVGKRTEVTSGLTEGELIIVD